jgi:hypothetical protein
LRNEADRAAAGLRVVFDVVATHLLDVDLALALELKNVFFLMFALI